MKEICINRQIAKRLIVRQIDIQNKLLHRDRDIQRDRDRKANKCIFMTDISE